MHKIYIIEDDPNISKIIVEHLSKYQFECYTVQQFNHIVEEFQAIQPHLVVMDINLPTYHRICASERHRSSVWY